jgi:hypothetical protein
VLRGTAPRQRIRQVMRVPWHYSEPRWNTRRRQGLFDERSSDIEKEVPTMTLQVYGPRAQQFVDLLAEFTGLTLVLTGEAVTRSPNTLINPYESSTLQNLVSDIVSGAPAVRLAAFSTAPTDTFSVDWFFANPGIHYPRRSVFVSDIQLVAGMSPILARGAMGHVLREYFGAARPPGQAPASDFANYHVPAILTEAQIVSDLTGRPIWTGNTRPWEHTYGNIMVRSYGPSLKFQLVMSAAGELTGVIQPAGI